MQRAGLPRRMTNFFDNLSHGDYPAEWGPEERALWDSEPNTYREFYQDRDGNLTPEYAQLQEAFTDGWAVRLIGEDGEYEQYSLSKEEREAARDDFFAIAGITEDSFDWEDYRDYLAAIGINS